ncbi:hypothetical protein CC99x_007850 [Candidatus Berkiella cookevillensis]|uniref:DUF6602 domain-containing protein n=1 Tax=Candidatus Berkiella cookevillensis TaxID=437022 RepID=A0A0Q9Y8P6_9GAMM|nr:DUF6602 domain-containing protein [Candidatus Berkiella cookevillensis]MCS5708816.1 hypothetical protein [Candidatus Berkiella cookevillensis]
MKTKPYNLLDSYHAYATDIWLAREKAKLIHSTKDIKSSGNEVEICARNVLSKILPKRFYVGHGHIIDVKRNISRQFDIIISDADNVPVLFKAEDGTEYIPFESVYAVGEIRSTFNNPKEINDFSEHIKSLNEEFYREKTKPNEFNDFALDGSNITTSDKRPYKNPLFKFMLFVDGNSIENKIEELSIFVQAEQKNLPNVTCFLNKGVILNWRLEDIPPQIKAINAIPEFSTRKKLWCFRKPGDANKILGGNLSALLLVLMNHLQNCTLKKPNLLDYFSEYIFFEKNAVAIGKERTS